MEMKKYPVYARNSGLEIRQAEIVKKNRRKGVVFLRAFPYDGGKEKQIFIMLNPPEAHKVGRGILAAKKSRKGIPNIIVHKKDPQDKNSPQKSVSIDFWEKDDGKKKGIAVVIRDTEKDLSVSVPLVWDEIEFLSDLFKDYALEIAYEERVTSSDEAEEETPVPEEQAPIDDDEDDFPF